MKFKRFFAAVSAAVMLGACSLSSVSAELVAPDSYDVNSDGRVNISDAVLINTALGGQWRPSDMSWLDVNGNGIVDNLDYMSIVAYVTMTGIPTITMQ